jgi:protein SCO1/2
MGRLGHGARAAITIALIVTAATIGMLVAGAREGGSAPPPAPGLRASVLPQSLDGAPAPRIALRDQRGVRIDSAQMNGHPYLVTFLYTHCTDVCPVIGSEIADAFTRLRRRAGDASALAVSVDPRGDSPAAARRWIAERRLPAQFHFLLGSPAQLTPIWRDWFVVAPHDRLTDPRTHAASVWLVDGRGRLRGRWSGGAPIDPADLAHDLGALIDEVRGSSSS